MESLIGRRSGVEYLATVLDTGRIRTESGGLHRTPSAAAADAQGTGQPNGWTFWTLKRNNQTLDGVRRRYKGPV
ncbi:hypothetical protein [Pseudofrankia sp. BMG5.37]|uniref:restriction system modified-DNA reader domain-containing protein n=1 Tax=Pseudofrankia sp. BMG5.37 TaxID=3050035 RepID=UPI0037C5875F